MTLSDLQCIASTVGFDDSAWAASYYPDNCPADWRIAYFSNDFRGVYLPFDTWYEQPGFVHMLAQELEAGFELTIGWPSLVQDRSVKAILDQLSPLQGAIRSVVIDAAAVGGEVCFRWAEEIGQHYTVVFDHMTAEIATLAEQKNGARHCGVWRPALSDEPAMSGSLLIVILPCQSLRDIKQILSQLSAAARRGVRIRLFFEPAAQSAARAMETRTLIELMGLA